MDIVFDPPGSGMFQEVYLYEELMEADLHAIVRNINLRFRMSLNHPPRSGRVSLCRTRTSSRSSIRLSVASRYALVPSTCEHKLSRLVHPLSECSAS